MEEKELNLFHGNTSKKVIERICHGLEELSWRPKEKSIELNEMVDTTIKGKRIDLKEMEELLMESTRFDEKLLNLWVSFVFRNVCGDDNSSIACVETNAHLRKGGGERGDMWKKGNTKSSLLIIPVLSEKEFWSIFVVVNRRTKPRDQGFSAVFHMDPNREEEKKEGTEGSVNESYIKLLDWLNREYAKELYTREIQLFTSQSSKLYKVKGELCRI